MRRRLVLAGAVGLLLVAAFFAGRFTVPAKVEVRETVKTVVDADAIARAVAFARSEWKQDVKTTTRTVYRDGKPVEKVVYRDAVSGGSSAASSSSEAATKTTAKTEAATVTVVERDRPGWRVSGQVGVGSDLSPLYGAEASRRLAGPFWIGAWGRTDKTAGLSLGVEW